MFARIKFATVYWLIWVFVFQLSRIAFLMYNFRDTQQYSFQSLLGSCWHGFRMDISMASYIVIPVCLFLMIGIILSAFNKPVVYKIYTFIILIPVLLLVFCDFPAFRAWGFRLDATPLKYLVSPKEAWASVSHLPVFWILLIYIVTLLLVYRLFSTYIRKYLDTDQFNTKKNPAFVLLLLFTGIQIIPIRGGFQLAPLNQSSVYFSTENYINLAAINVTWNFMHSLSHDLNSTENPFQYLDKNISRQIKDSLMKQDPVSDQLINLTETPTPNIILIVWESFTKKAVGLSRNGVPVTPGFNQLIKEGVYFSDVYATGDRTDKGIVGILSGYPAQPTTSIIKIPQKAAKLPKLPSLYADKGYNSSFYYGGELEFANMKAYLMGCRFGNYISKDAFDTKDQNSKWGAHDGVVKNRIIKDLPAFKSPFFLTWLTLSSHEPYETPVPAVIDGKDDESKFLNSLHYADSSVYDFVQYCKAQPFWQNTIMIIVADHGHRLPQTDSRVNDFKIPVLWLGGALKQKGIVINKTASQLDIAATLVQQTGFTTNPFPWSRNLLAGGSQWAYFCFNNGFGYVEPSKYFLFDNVGKQPMDKNGILQESDFNKGKSIQQESFTDYLEK